MMILSIVRIQDCVLSKCKSMIDDTIQKQKTHTVKVKPLAFTQEEAKRRMIWRKISNKLCPAMIPQSTKYARHLFHLAQMEILQGNSSQEVSNTTTPTPANCTALEEQKNPNATTTTSSDRNEFAVRFFEHHDGWETMSHLHKGQSEIYSFLSIWKCANQQIRMFQKQIVDDWTLFENRWNQFSRIKYRGFRLTSIAKMYTKSNPAVNKSELLTDSNKMARLLKKMKDFKDKKVRLTDCMVAVIRDPIAHFLSGYNEIEYRINIELKDPRVSIANAWPFGRDHPVGSTERFEQFVADLVTCPIGNNLPGIVEKLPNNLEMEHVYSMSSILRLIDKDPHVNNSNINFHYLPSLANLNKVWGPFVVLSCPNSFSNETKTKLLTMPMIEDASVKHRSSDDPLDTYKAAKMVMKQEGPAAKALCALHLMDYACWKNLPDGVPKLCMDLYLDYYKRDLLLL